MKKTLLILAFSAIAHTAVARPQFFFFDASQPSNAPSLFGYDVTATQTETNVIYSIRLDAHASKAFRSAAVFSTSRSPMPKTNIAVSTDKTGQKHIRFSVSIRRHGHCILTIDSAPLNMEHASLRDFVGYRLVLDKRNIEDPQQPPERDK